MLRPVGGVPPWAPLFWPKARISMSTYRAAPVFFDPDNKRWPRLRRGVFLTGLVLSTLFGVLIFSILINPLLPELHLPQSSLFGKGTRTPTAELIETEPQRKLREAKQKL